MSIARQSSSLPGILGEIADAVAWLMAAPGVTGQMIAVDAGQHLAWAGA